MKKAFRQLSAAMTAVSMMAGSLLVAPLTAYAAPPDIGTVTLSLEDDADSNTKVNIGDTIRVVVEFTDALGCGDTTADADMLQYGFGEDPVALSGCVDLGGGNYSYTTDFELEDADGDGIDVAVSDPASRIFARVNNIDGFTGDFSNALAYEVDTIAPEINSPLGDDSEVTYELPSTCPSSAACNRGDIYGAALTFINEPLGDDGEEAVENAILAAADEPDNIRIFVWSGTTVRIMATGPVGFSDNVYAQLEDDDGNTAAGLLIDVEDSEDGSSVVTDGSVVIGDFPSDSLEDTAWRIDTSTVGDAAIIATSSDFLGPSDATLPDDSGWTELFSSSDDDAFVELPLGFSMDFNGDSYSSVFIGSNTYLTFGDGHTDYSDLGSGNPPLPSVQLCAADNSYQWVLYRLDAPGQMRVRYEGTDSTSGSLGSPTIVYEAVFYEDESYIEVYVGANARCVTPITEVWVDDDWADQDDVDEFNEDLTWQTDAFSNIQDGLDVVAVDGTVYVNPGEYAEELSMDTADVTLSGDPSGEEDAVGAGEDAPLLTGDSCDTRIAVNADGVTIEGLYITAGCPNADILVEGEDAEIYRNTIENSEFGVVLGEGSAGAEVWENFIDDHLLGILLDDADAEGISIHDNEITGTDTGIYFDSWSPSVVVNGNSIHDNGDGLAVDDGGDSNYLDITENWWGDPAGPNFIDETDGDDISNDSDDIVLFRPFCVDEDCEELSTQEAELSDLEEMLFTGTLQIEGTDFNATPSISVNEDLTLTLPSGSSVELPAGTDITRTGGGDLDVTTLDLDTLDAGTVVGLDDEVAGAMLWGASEGLTFDPAITINIFVGTSFNGDELDVYRSPDGGTTWTQVGIVPPAECTVSAGLCTFQTTLASHFAATVSPGGGGGGGGYYAQAPQGTPTPISPIGPADSANLARYGLREGDTVRSPDSNDPDVYIVNEWGYKRLFLNPAIFNFYGHLGGWAAVRSISPVGRDAFPTSGLFRNCETNDQQVYAAEVTGEDTGTLHHVQLSGDAAVAQDPAFFRKVFCINNNEFNWYSKSPMPYTALSQVPVYRR